MESVSRWVVRHRLWVGLFWLAITILAAVLAPSVSGRLKGGDTVNSAVTGQISRSRPATA